MDQQNGFDRMNAILGYPSCPGAEVLIPVLRDMKRGYDEEDPVIRPRDGQDRPGGLLFLPDLPVVLVPDLHARTEFLAALAWWTPPGMERPVLELLEDQQIQIVCMGDGFHSESPRASRWAAAYEEYLGNFRRHRAMDDEMRDSLRLMLLVMDWKIHYPRVFHFLKGNHENVANENSPDNRGFYKFAAEGDMVNVWFRRFLGEEAFVRYYEFEKSLPIMAAGREFCVSHAEPRRYYTREEIINCYSRREIIFDFTWTDNDESHEGTVEKYLEDYFPGSSRARYYGGHRPVRGPYHLRAGGRYVQIHNPLRFPVIFLKDPADMENDNGLLYLDF